jgi:ubiquinone/menaquinone biosynthesis C-methylase UbiE
MNRQTTISEYAFYIQSRIISEMKPIFSLNPKVLDLGCGNGGLVAEYRKNNIEAFGCDFRFKKGSEVESLSKKGLIRLLEDDPYRLPFEDNSIDIVVTDQVFEHIKDYPSTLAEIRRVLKPEGISLHMFPSRYKPIEAHVMVPFASIIQNYWWLWLWAHLGVRTESQDGLSAVERAKRNYEYLNDSTNYLTTKELKKYIGEYFETVHFCEIERLKYTRRGKYIYPIVKRIPFLGRVYSAFRGRIVYFE